MGKSFIYENANTLRFKRTFKIWIYGYREISVSITVIDSFILACQRIFLRVLISIQPWENGYFEVKKILKKGGIKKYIYNQKIKWLVHTGTKERHSMELEYATTSLTNSGYLVYT
ncbi:MAG: hypothetical protein J7K04_00930 [Spirochaetales bacterium]|nr:hypothetical protein [Spirochaetales bacterium]